MVTTSGNNIYVYSGPIDQVENDDELAAVLAHELGHNFARHVVDKSEADLNEVFSSQEISWTPIAEGWELYGNQDVTNV